MRNFWIWLVIPTPSLRYTTGNINLVTTSPCHRPRICVAVMVSPSIFALRIVSILFEQTSFLLLTVFRVEFVGCACLARSACSLINQRQHQPCEWHSRQINPKILDLINNEAPNSCVFKKIISWCKVNIRVCFG